MFDILVYLFETYTQPSACPESAVLARKLSAIGFEQEDIAAALEWLSGLESLAFEQRLAILSGSQRLYCAVELAKLPTFTSITKRKAPLPDADEWKDKTGKLALLIK